MSKNTCRMIGLLTTMVSVFFLIGGLYLPHAGLPPFVAPACLITGLILLVTGILFDRVIKSE